jgi:hypothetical protein
MNQDGLVEAEDLPAALVSASAGMVVPARERRRRVDDCLYEALTSGACSFWDHVYPMFINRDITRTDLTRVVRQALAATGGNYRSVLTLFHMDPGDYKRFLNFLTTHGCTVDFREYRTGRVPDERQADPPFDLEVWKTSIASEKRERSAAKAQ